MSKTLKLSPKQLAAIQQIEAQKQQLANMTQDANNKQSLVVELAFEAVGIDIATAEQIRLEGDSILYDVKEVKATKPIGKNKVEAVSE